MSEPQIEKLLSVKAHYVSQTETHPRFAEDAFADAVGEIVDPLGGRVSNYGVSTRTPEGWPVHCLVWWKKDSPFVTRPSKTPRKTAAHLRELAEVLYKKVPRQYTNLRITLDTTTHTAEELMPQEPMQIPVPKTARPATRRRHP